MKSPSRVFAKRILGKIYLGQISGKVTTPSYLASKIKIDKESLMPILRKMRRDGLVESEKGILKLTESGRQNITVVMTGGAFDIIHPGHLETLEKSRALGDLLIVSVARNVTFQRNKKRKPLHDEKLRAKLVSSLRPVDAAVLGSKTDIFSTVEMLRPDVIALGYDQSHAERVIRAEARRRGLRVRVTRLSSSVPEMKTSKMIQNRILFDSN